MNPCSNVCELYGIPFEFKISSLMEWVKRRIHVLYGKFYKVQQNKIYKISSEKYVYTLQQEFEY